MKRIIRLTHNDFPAQFWVLFWGMLISTTGASMIWPFLMIYVSGKLELPMTSVASLMTLNASAGLVSSFFVGSITDRAGRKVTMIVGLVCTGLLYLAMVPASTFMGFALVMTLRGFFNPLYAIGSRAMIADLIPENDRADAYALTRLSNNLGIALGPAMGGFIATASYAIAFWCAAAGLVTFGVIILLLTHETLPPGAADGTAPATGLRTYQKVFSDRAFISFALAFTLTQVGATMVWMLMGVHAKENYNLLENQYGLIPMTNALMVVALQVFVTRVTKNYRPLLMLGLGAAIYAGGVGSVAFATGFWGFWTSMVILTWGELILVPTATTYVANISPADMRGRYMSIFTLSWGVATGIGPLIGGFLNDTLSPAAIWYGGGAIGLLGAALFLSQFWGQTRQVAPVK